MTKLFFIPAKDIDDFYKELSYFNKQILMIQSAEIVNVSYQTIHIGGYVIQYSALITYKTPE